MLKDIFEQVLKHEIKYLDSSFIYSQYVLRERLLVLSGYCIDAKKCKANGIHAWYKYSTNKTTNIDIEIGT